MEASTPFKSSLQVYEWIEGFINLERDLNSRPMRLDHMKKLCSLAGNPENCAPAIHIAGSKGKGSVCAMITSILGAGGKRCMRYASPHVRDFRERITLNNSFLSEEVYAEAGNELRKAAVLYQNDGIEPSFFELFTLWFFLCGRLSKCDFLSVETGLGGRLDATNIIDPVLSVITVIEKEHTEILGDTITKIAGEKAGIIKKNRPLVLARQNEEALEVFRSRTEETDSPLYYFPECVEINSVKTDRNGSTYDLKIKTDLVNIELKSLRIKIPGDVQIENSCLAALAAKTAFPMLTGKNIYDGLASFSLPGRFEKIKSNYFPGSVFIVDGAHTALSFAECIKTFTGLYGNTGYLIFGCAAGKDVNAMAEAAVGNFSNIIITTPGNFKKSFPEEIYEVFLEQKCNKQSSVEIHFIPETGNAVKFAGDNASASAAPVLVSGSFYLVSELHEYFSRHQD